MSSLLLWSLLSLSLPIATGCTEFPISVKECGDKPVDLRVNERGDQEEFSGHPLSVAKLRNGRLLVAFSAQTFDAKTGDSVTSEVRLALLDHATGARLTLCNTSNRDRTLSNPGAFAFGASVAPVDLRVLGNEAVALVAWTEGSFPSSHVTMRFIDGAGCPLGGNFLPYSQPASVSSVTWSEQRGAVLVTLHDERRIYRAWVDDQGPANTAPIAAGQSFIYGFPVAAVASDGSAVVVWAENLRGPLGVLLDSSGNPRVSEFSDPTGVFPIRLPLIAPADQVVFSLSVAAADQIVVGVEQRTVNRSVPSRVLAREYTLDGASPGTAYFLDPDDRQEQEAPVFRYAPGGTLIAVWDSKSAGGTVGRVFGHKGEARFNSLSCDNKRFLIGQRAETQLGFPSLLIADNDVFVMHNAQGGDDPLGNAAFLWKYGFADLWPGPQ